MDREVMEYDVVIVGGGRRREVLGKPVEGLRPDAFGATTVALM